MKTYMSESLFYKVTNLQPPTLFKKRLWHRCFPVNFLKFLRLSVLNKHDSLKLEPELENGKIKIKIKKI